MYTQTRTHTHGQAHSYLRNKQSKCLHVQAVCFCAGATEEDMSADKAKHNKNFVLAQPCHKVTHYD